MNKQEAARRKWYKNSPLCPDCGERVYVAGASIGFFGLNVSYFKKCNDCLPPEIAAEARRIKKSFLGED